MPTVTSADGTTIAYDRTGDGPPVVLVDGAMCYRDGGPMRPLAALLRDAFTVYTYDRRGRGESSDTQPYAVAREVEDLQSLIAQTGGRGIGLRHLLGRGARPGNRGGRPGDHQAGPLRASVPGGGRGRLPDQGVHRTPRRAPRRRTQGRRRRTIHDARGHARAGRRRHAGPAGLEHRWRRSHRRSPTTTRCWPAAACPATWRPRSPFRRWSSPAVAVLRGCSRPRRQPRRRSRRRSTARLTARRTTWRRTRSHPCWSSSSAPDRRFRVAHTSARSLFPGRNAQRLTHSARRQ